jgi:hypothetical protein
MISFSLYCACVLACVECSPICCLPDFPHIIVANSHMRSDVANEQAQMTNNNFVPRTFRKTANDWHKVWTVALYCWRNPSCISISNFHKMVREFF